MLYAALMREEIRIIKRGYPVCPEKNFKISNINSFLVYKIIGRMI